jgi:DNA-binding IclR family transcriptional regulator
MPSSVREAASDVRLNGNNNLARMAEGHEQNARRRRADEAAESQQLVEKDKGVAAVERGLLILQAFREGNVSLTLHELAQRTGLYKSTLLRLIVTLEKHHCIVRLADGRYQLGPMLLHLGRLYQRSLQFEDHIVPVLEQLVTETGESASFYTRHGDRRLCLFRVNSARLLRDHVNAGDFLPLDRGAAGRVLLEYSSPEASGKKGAPLVVSFGERDADVAAIAVPVFGPSGTLLGALSISGPTTRFTDDAVKRMSSAILAAAAQLTTRLGGDPGRLNASLD